MIGVRGLTKRYGATLAVDGLRFTVRPGLVTGFLGPNGAGKTTTMHQLPMATARALRFPRTIRQIAQCV
jgi:ABC-type multidrug transport system ATPase subunit